VSPCKFGSIIMTCLALAKKNKKFMSIAPDSRWFHIYDGNMRHTHTINPDMPPNAPKRRTSWHTGRLVSGCHSQLLDIRTNTPPLHQSRVSLFVLICHYVSFCVLILGRGVKCTRTNKDIWGSVLILSFQSSGHISGLINSIKDKIKDTIMLTLFVLSFWLEIVSYMWVQNGYMPLFCP
jgi:hypothetical protein